MAPPCEPKWATDGQSFTADWFEFFWENKMLNITRFNPLDDAFENWFRGVPVWLPNPETRAPAQPQFRRDLIRMDVTENDKGYRVLAELPGVKKEDISITINGNEVAVSAEVNHEKDAENSETVLRAERYYGKIERAFSLGQEVDEATAQAKYNDGVLELTLPKKAVGAAKRLAVH
jgi:HSP20 family protein